MSRRSILRWGVGGLAAAPLAAAGRSRAAEIAAPEERAGCLVDTTRCIGCRRCEEACAARNRMPAPERPYEDRSVLLSPRRPDASALTVVNRYPSRAKEGEAQTPPTFVKFQCLHCLKPACVSACIVGALTQAADGAVIYNPGICIGCRYCMIACPFQIPAYEYRKALLPRVRKCEFCADRKKKTGADPACAAACPTEALRFGKRAALLRAAHERIEAAPKRYLRRVYGETEAGGTSWLYLAGRPFAEIGLLEIGPISPAVRTEAIQHGVYRYGLIPLALYGVLGGLMWRNRRLKRKGCPALPDEEGSDE